MKKITFILLLLTSTIFSQEVKVMTYNIKYHGVRETENRWVDRKEHLIKLLSHYDASFIGLQESLLDQVQYIERYLKGYNYIGVGRDDGRTRGEYSPIFYNPKKYTLLDSKTIWLSETPDKPSKGWDAALNRVCTYGLFKNIETDKKIWVFNTHFDHIGRNAKKNSVDLLLNVINGVNSENYPVVLMGDLNLTPDEEPIQLLSRKLNDGKTVSLKPFYGPVGTFNSFRNEEIKTRIDYIFTKNIQVLNYEHIDDRLPNNKHISDHLPVLTTLKF
jgi:endonuclease/exonuclease/phosphatase family metal-dependent hydrolase